MCSSFSRQATSLEGVAMPPLVCNTLHWVGGRATPEKMAWQWRGQHGECDRWTRTHPETVLFSLIYLPHYKTTLLLPLHPHFLLPPLLIRVSIPRTVDRLLLWSGPGQLLEWVIVISLCLDQSTPIQAERQRTGARGTTDCPHQQQICEMTAVWPHYVRCNSFFF